MADTQTLPRRGFLSPWTRLPLWKQIFIALVLGLSLGVVLNQVGRADLAADIKPLGDLFIRGIKMLIVPLVFVSLVTGVASLNNLSKMGRLSFKTLLLYLGMTAVAIAIGLVLASVFQPGVGIELGTVAAVAVPEAPTAVETLLGLVPTNAVEAFAEGNVLQIIVFAILFGLCITLVGEKARPVREFFESAAEIIYRMTSIIIAFTPYGVFALMTWVAGTYGLEMLLPLAKVIGIVYLGCIVHAVVVYGGMLRFLARLNPLRYFQGSIEPIMLAFTSTSSAGTLPVTMMAAEQNLGVKRGVSSFVLPLGPTINMQGNALYQGVCAIFIAHAYGVYLGARAY
ncbi:MAG: dicarboxylate/amino acid:cation symporter [Halomonas sp.]|nr:dicarboxylate/amino acid:cation symporter [Halomonas sp.]